MFITVTGMINGSLEPIRINVNHIMMYYPCEEGDHGTKSAISFPRNSHKTIHCTQTVMEIRTAIENVQTLHSTLAFNRNRTGRSWYTTKGNDETS